MINFSRSNVIDVLSKYSEDFKRLRVRGIWYTAFSFRIDTDNFSVDEMRTYPKNGHRYRYTEMNPEIEEFILSIIKENNFDVPATIDGIEISHGGFHDDLKQVWPVSAVKQTLRDRIDAFSKKLAELDSKYED